MDDQQVAISPHDLRQSIGAAGWPLLIDVRRSAAFDSDDSLIAGAIRRTPENADAWRHEIGAARRVIVYCVHGREVSQGVAAVLAAAGIDAHYLEGGIAAWRELGLPTRRRIGASPGKWVTRDRPRVDRIACPWLVRRFIDPEAEFLYVPSATVREVAARTGAVPYDIAGAEFGHVGDYCSFDAFIRIFGIADAALDRLAVIVRGADTGAPNLAPEAAGLVAISSGLSATIADDQAMLAHGMVIYDALFAWCCTQIRAAPRS